MSLAFNILILLIAASPVLVFIDDTVAFALEIAVIAIGSLTVAFNGRAADADHIGRATTAIFWIFPLALLLIVAQLVPLPLSWSHPIWASAAEALLGVTFGHVTLDVGRTLQALFSSIGAIAATIVTIAVARDRRRAELILLAASAVITLFTFTVLLQKVIPLKAAAAISRDVAVNFSCLGTLLSVAVILLAFERRETRRKQASSYLPIGLGGAAALLFNIGTLYALADASQWISMALGLTMLLLLLAIRRLGLSRLSTLVLCAASLVGAVIVTAWLFDKNPATSGLLRFIPAPNSETLVILQRLLADSRWFGSGSGTFDVVARIYQSGEPTIALMAPTTAIALAVETGWIGLLIFALIGLSLFLKLFWGALERGRDWFFPAIASATVAASLCNSLVLPGIFQPATTIILAIVVGIGLSQGFSQTAR